MRFKSRSEILPLRTLIGRSFLISMASVLFIMSIAAILFNQAFLQDKVDNNSNILHKMLSNLITPPLIISDVMEVRRLLQMASGINETFVVVSKGSIYMPDYEQIYLVNSVIDKNKNFSNCNKYHSIFRQIGSNGYWISCTILEKDDVVEKSDNNLGVLLSFTKYRRFDFAKMTLFFCGMSFIILFIIYFWFRNVLQQKLIKPLIALENITRHKYKTNTSTDFRMDEMSDAPAEILSIKFAFEALLLNLQNEYKLRVETEKKEILSDFAAQVVHDIRSPLAILEITLSTVSNYIPEKDVMIQKKALQGVREIVNNLLIQYRRSVNILSILPNHLDMYSSTSESVRFSMKYYLEDLILCKQREWFSNPCKISLYCDDPKKIDVVELNPNYFKCMISNLLNNSYESLSNDRIINIFLEVLPSSIMLKISDSGCGIEKAHISDVLMGKSFKHDGVGLGLSGAARYMLAIGGNIELRSEIGRGTDVILHFPVVQFIS